MASDLHPIDFLPINQAPVCFVDPSSGCRKTYAELATDSSVADFGPEPGQIVFQDWYGYIVALLRAIRWDRTAALLPAPTQLALSSSPAMSGSGGSTPDHSPAVLPRELDANLFTASRCQLGIITSGTTGSPKLVWHRLATLARGVRTEPRRQGDTWGLAYHPTHFAGLQVIFQAVANRNPLVRLFGLESSEVHAAIRAERITAISATPTFYRLLCTPDAPSHPEVRQVTVGGERFAGKLLELLPRVFPQARIRNIYASSEAGSLLVSDGDAFRIPESLRAYVRVTEGRLEVHRSLLAESLQAIPSGKLEGESEFVPTGDRIEWLEARETFKIVGREAEQLNIGGFKVNPGEIEDAVCSYLEVAAARVYGRPNSVTGMLLCCDVVLRQPHSLTAKELRHRLSEKFPTYKVPGLVNFVESIAQTYSGKQAKQG